MPSNASAHALTKDNIAMFELAETVRGASHSLAATALDKGHDIVVGLKTKGNMLRIEISDSGEAFAEEMLPKSPQPFSTGNGLGLSLVKDVAKSHDGYLAVV